MLSLGVIDNLLVKIVGKLPDEAYGHGLYFGSLESREGSQDLVWTGDC